MHSCWVGGRLLTHCWFVSLTSSTFVVLLCSENTFQFPEARATTRTTSKTDRKEVGVDGTHSLLSHPLVSPLSLPREIVLLLNSVCHPQIVQNNDCKLVKVPRNRLQEQPITNTVVDCLRKMVLLCKLKQNNN